MCCKSPSVYCNMAGTVVSLISVIAASTLPFPMTTILVMVSSLDLLAKSAFTCAVISEHLKVIKISLILTTLMLLKSLILFLSSIFMEYGFMKELFQHLIKAQDIAPEVLRLLMVVAGVIIVLNAIIMECQAICLYRKMKRLDPVIPWSYKDQGFSLSNIHAAVLCENNEQAMIMC